jgi:hypothetical protein
VVLADEPEATATIAEFLGGASAVSTTPVRVQVLNGNGVSGAAGEMSELLETAGFEIAGVGNADSRNYTTTTVVVPEGSSVGDRIVGEIGFGVVQFGTVDNGYDAVVIVGADAP